MMEYLKRVIFSDITGEFWIRLDITFGVCFVLSRVRIVVRKLC